MKLARRPERSTDQRILAVEAGQVVCPRRGIVDLERCWNCPDYDGLSGGRIEGVVCRADPSGFDTDAERAAAVMGPFARQ
jgi:hypothetical protein